VLAVIIAAIMLWTRPGAGTVPGKIYFTIVAAAAVALIVVLGSQQLLLPPL
jgi:hypothetical protein